MSEEEAQRAICGHCGPLSLDTETTGLMPYHGDRVFMIVVSTGKDTWNYHTGKSVNLPRSLGAAFLDKNRIWFLHNAKFDMHAFWNTFGVVPKGRIHDTAIGARLVFNDYLTYSLDACASRIGFKKSNAVEEFIRTHKLSRKDPIPGKKKKIDKKFYDQVPHEIMFEYACIDAEITHHLGMSQLSKMAELDALLPSAPKLTDFMEVERQLAPVLFEMERDGVLADQAYCAEAMEFYEKEIKRLEEEFKRGTGETYKASPKLFEKVFGDQKDKWSFTEKGNPSFDSDVLERFDSLSARLVLGIRNAKSRVDFFSTFLFFSDGNSCVHPSFNSGGTATLRFSSSEPNFQNLTNDEESETELRPVRRAIVPPKDFCIVAFDYDQQEYRLLLDYAGQMDLIEAIKGGADVHQATADLMGVTRRAAKAINFGLLYGMGLDKLAAALKVSRDEAKRLKALYFQKLPNVKQIIHTITNVAETRGYVYNWAGVRYWCNDPKFAYKMPNRIIQGGGASIMKKAMVEIAPYLLERKAKSRMFLTVHDELDFYIHKDEFDLVKGIKYIMENVYVSKHLPLTVSVSHSWKSLGDLQDGEPSKEAHETRDKVSGVQCAPVFAQSI